MNRKSARLESLAAVIGLLSRMMAAELEWTKHHLAKPPGDGKVAKPAKKNAAEAAKKRGQGKRDAKARRDERLRSAAMEFRNLHPDRNREQTIDHVHRIQLKWGKGFAQTRATVEKTLGGIFRPAIEPRKSQPKASNAAQQN